MAAGLGEWRWWGRRRGMRRGMIRYRRRRRMRAEEEEGGGEVYRGRTRRCVSICVSWIP